MAKGTPHDTSLLEGILAELSERKNDIAFSTYIEVGKILEVAQEHAAAQQRLRRVLDQDDWNQNARDGYFEWPSTDAPASIFGFEGDFFFYQEGLLSFVGYRAGHNGESDLVRRRILDCVFHNELPHVNSAKYMEEWGTPQQLGRLAKMAQSLAAFTRNAKRRNEDLSQAIEDWEKDLDYLYRKYYINRFHFAWPAE